MKRIIAIVALIIISTTFCANASASENFAGSSAALLKSVREKTPDSRVKILKEFLKQYNSPLVHFAPTFIETADRYNLDWKLVVAISGVESTFGREIPYESFNGWGWGIYGDNMIRFSSWKEGIETVSQGLRINYINKWGAQNVYEIGRFYAASPTWASRVTYFMKSIDIFKDQKLAQSLSISL
ncbi:MAG: glucosaminidase domain-containing protein [Candidatus Levybacteria bacterium]|nr:glucosaminidase domain-containing protein [Candidatus Levybacteria bacterium]